MKKLLLIILTTLLPVIIYGQSFRGFFQPADKAIELNEIRSVGAAPSSRTVMFRPNVFITAEAVRFGGGEPQMVAFKSSGMGISCGWFSDVDGKAYCNYSVNASLLTSVILGGETSTEWGAAVTADVFNKLIGVGVGYLDCHPLLLLTVSYSF